MTRKKSKAPAAKPEKKEVTATQLINTVGDVCAYLETITVPGDHKSVNNHRLALERLAGLQQELIKRFKEEVEDSLSQ